MHLPGQKPEPEPEPEPEPGLEDARVRLWRYRQVRKLGLNPIEARLFAESDADVGKFRGLISKGCDPATALDILL